MKETKFKPWLAITVFILATVIFWGFLASFMVSKFSILQTFLLIIPGEELLTDTNVLLLGTDATEGVQRSDTIIFAHISPAKRAVSVISIPRDLLVIIPGMGFDKINHAYAYGGVDLSRKTVANYLGLPINNYIHIDLKGLISIIDQLGGISLNVEKKMYYVDRAGGLYIDLNPGFQKLNGQQAMGYVRFRHDNYGDIGRITRQQKFIGAFVGELIRSKNILKLPFLLQQLSTNIKTDLSARKILTIAAELKLAYEQGNIQMHVIPGTGEYINGVYYMRPNDWETRQILDTLEKGPISNTLENLHLEILNGDGHAGLAREIAGKLDAKGIQVVQFGDAENFNFEKSCILDWNSKKNSIESFANLMRIDKKQITRESKRKEGKGIDLTLILGHDWVEKIKNL